MTHYPDRGAPLQDLSAAPLARARARGAEDVQPALHATLEALAATRSRPASHSCSPPPARTGRSGTTRALRSELGLDRQATGERLLQLARSRDWEVAWDRRGFVKAIAPVPLERRKYLVQREVIPEVPR